MTTIPATHSSTTAATSSGTSASASSSDPMSALSGNMNEFLQLLMAQLQNQDPTSPMDVSTFTSQLVQYSSVEQQINTNSNLQTLINATQSNMILGSSSLVGKQATVTNGDLTLQNGAATVGFTVPGAETVNIEVQAADGTAVLRTTMQAQSGQNSWTWDGTDSNGTQRPDGAYKVTVTDPSESTVATTTAGTITGVSRSGSSVQVSLGGLSTDVSTIQSVANN